MPGGSSSGYSSNDRENCSRTRLSAIRGAFISSGWCMIPIALFPLCTLKGTSRYPTSINYHLAVCFLLLCCNGKILSSYAHHLALLG